MKILFLDIDGVLNSERWNQEHEQKICEGVLIDRTKIDLLSGIIMKTGAEIVLHSGWKFWLDEFLNPLRKESEILMQLLSDQGMKIYDVTPDFSTEEIRRTRKFSRVKAKEILGWLELHSEVTGWAVLDDLDLHNDVVEEKQVKTDAKVGLTQENVVQVIEKLNGARVSLMRIRKAERESYLTTYANTALFERGTWLQN